MDTRQHTSARIAKPPEMNDTRVMMEKITPCQYKRELRCVKPFATGNRRDYRCPWPRLCCIECGHEAWTGEPIILTRNDPHFKCSTRCKTYG